MAWGQFLGLETGLAPCRCRRLPQGAGLTPHAPRHPLAFLLVIALPGTAEVDLERLARLELGKRFGSLAPAVPRYRGHRRPDVASEDVQGHPAGEGKVGDVTAGKAPPPVFARASPKPHRRSRGGWGSGANVSAVLGGSLLRGP